MPRERIFVYGMLLDPNWWGHPPGSIAMPAELPGWALKFHGLATVVPQEGGTVYGALIDTPNLDPYDRLEGVRPDDPTSAFGLYRREPVHVDLGEDGIVTAWVYVENQPRHPSPPGAEYERLIRYGYHWYSLPEEALDVAIQDARQAIAGRSSF